MTEGFKILDAYVEVHADASKVASDAESQLRGQGSIMSRAGSGLGGFLMSGMTGVVGGLVGGVVSAFAQPLVNGVQNALSTAFQAAKGAVVDYNSQLEQANIGFTTMLGSAGKAKDFINDLQVFAKNTPFAFTDLTNYSQQMIGYGINAQKVIPYLTALGDAAAGAGKSSAELGNAVLAFEQMAAKGTVDLGNLNQLTNAGIPAVSILAEKYKVTKGELLDLISKGKIAADDALPKLIDGIEKGTKSTAAFGGMMDKQSKTFAGAMGNLSDSFNQTLSTAGQPFFKFIEDLGKQMADFAGSKEVQKWAKDTAKSLDDGLKKLKPFQDVIKDVLSGKGIDAKSDLGKALKPFNDELGKLPKDSAKTLKGLKDSFHDMLPDFKEFASKVGPSVIKILDRSIILVGDLTPLLKKLAPALKPIGEAFKLIVDFSPVSTLTDFQKAAEDTGLKADKSKTGIDALVSAFKGVKPNVKFANEALAGTRGPLAQFAARFVAAASVTGQAIRTVNQQIATNAKKIVDGITTMNGRIIAAMGQAASQMFTAGANLVQGLIGGIGSKIGEAISTIQSFAGQVAGAFRDVLKIQSPSKVFHQYGVWIAEGLQKGLLGSVDQIRAAGEKLADAVDKPMRAGVERVTKRLVGLAKQRDKVLDMLKDTKSTLADLRSSRDDYRSGVRSGVLGEGSLLDAYGTATDPVTTTTSSSAMAGSLDGRSYTGSYSTSITTVTPGVSGIQAVKARLRTLLTTTKQFTANMKRLVKMGLYSDVFQQLIQAGPTAGLALTNDLLNDKASFQEINSLAKQVATAGNLLGDYAAGITYDGQIASTQKEIGRLRNQRDNITAVMVIEARKIDEVDKVVKAVNALAKTAKAKKAAKK